MPEKLNYRTLPDLRPDISDADDFAYERPRVEVIYNGSKIISSLDLLKMDHDVLSFTGAWHGFLGEPSTTFHMALYGCAGQGKSTFAIQFANYLADNFGKVIYVSGEEGFAMTFQKKFIDYQAASPNLDVADLRTCGEFEKMVPLDTYKFIFVDSLNTMQISPTKLRALKLKHKGCAFITISQVTKAGDARGSYEIMHDSDLIVEVIGGKAITIKNRFLSTGKVYSVFRRNDHHS
jgi:predicted ATP-dependent serine protease